MPGRCGVEIAPEQAFKLALGQADTAGDFLACQRVFHVLLHLADGFHQLRVADPHPGMDGQMLDIAAVTYALMHQLFADSTGDLGAKTAHDFIQHHVAGRITTGTGEHSPVDFIQ